MTEDYNLIACIHSLVVLLQHAWAYTLTGTLTFTTLKGKTETEYTYKTLHLLML